MAGGELAASRPAAVGAPYPAPSWEMRGRGRGYLPQFFPRWLRPRTVELRGNPVGPFPASYPLTGAADVLLVPTRGHTFGRLSVIVEQPGEPRLVLAGDASYRQDLMLDGVVDGVAADERAARETRQAATVCPRAADRVPARPRPGVQWTVLGQADRPRLTLPTAGAAGPIAPSLADCPSGLALQIDAKSRARSGQDCASRTRNDDWAGAHPGPVHR